MVLNNFELYELHKEDYRGVLNKVFKISRLMNQKARNLITIERYQSFMQKPL